MKKAFLIIISFLAITSTFSCKKSIITKTDTTSIIAGKKWYVTGQSINGEDTYDSNYAECDKDDYVIFNKDGTLTNSQGTVICDASEEADVIIDGKSWRISGKKMYFVMDLPGNPEMDITIKIQTATQLVLILGDEGGDNITTTLSTK